MNLRKYAWLFGTTLLVGGVGGILYGLIIAWRELFTGSFSNFFFGITMSLLFGLTISVLSQMGFFAYLTLNYLALGFLRSAPLWRRIQVLLILFAMFDMVYLRYSLFGSGGSIWPFFLEPLALFAAAVVVAYWKVRETNGSAWIPTLFFLFAVTAVEWVPGLRQQSTESSFFMIVPLFLCNAWQVMNLHKLTKQES